jgi:hypothetical protein
MWDQYRKTAFPTQVFIFLSCAFVFYFGKAPLQATAIIFVVMQIGGLLGAWWGWRLRMKMERSAGQVPLERR